MDSVIDELRAKVQRLPPPIRKGTSSTYICGVCSKAMSSPGIVVADAGQAFEALSSVSIQSGIQHVFDLAAADSSFSTLQVLHGQGCSVAKGGCPKTSYRDRIIVRLATLKKAVHSFLGLKYFRIGDQLMFQVDGVPIGGNFSGSILENTLGVLEGTFSSKFSPLMMHVASGRYADDLILVSFTRCRKCLLSLIRRVYKDHISFDADSSQTSANTTTVQPYLDFIMYLDWDSLCFTPNPKNFKYAFTGDHSHRIKHSLEPYVGYFDEHTVAVHRAELIARVRRWTMIGCCVTVYTVMFCADFMVFIREGFSLEHVKRIIMSLQLPDTLKQIAWLSFDLVRITSVHLVNGEFSRHTLRSVTSLAQEIIQAVKAGSASSAALSVSSPSTDMFGGYQGYGGNGEGYGRGGKGYGDGKGRGYGGGKGYGPAWIQQPWSAPQQPWAQQQPAQGGAFSSMAGNFNNIMGDIAALGQMSQIGNILSNSTLGQSPCPSTGGSPVVLSPPGQGSTECVARDLAKSLAELASQAVPTTKGSPAEKTKLQSTIDQLATLAGRDTGDDADRSAGCALFAGGGSRSLDGSGGAEKSFNLEDAPAFMKLKQQVSEMGTTVSSHSVQLKGISETVGSTASNVESIKALLEGRATVAPRSSRSAGRAGLRPILLVVRDLGCARGNGCSASSMTPW